MISGGSFLSRPLCLTAENRQRFEIQPASDLKSHFERHWSIPFPGEIRMDRSFVHTFSWGNSYGPMVLKVLLKSPPTLVLVHRWIFPEGTKHGTTVPKTGTRVHSPKPTLLQNRPFVSSRTAELIACNAFLLGLSCLQSKFACFRAALTHRVLFPGMYHWNFNIYIHQKFWNNLICNSERQYYIKIFWGIFFIMGRLLSVMGSSLVSLVSPKLRSLGLSLEKGASLRKFLTGLV